MRRVKHRAPRCGFEGFRHDGFHGLLRVVAQVLLQGGVRAVAQVDVLPSVLTQNRRCARVQQELVRIETLALRRIPGAVHAPAVDQPGRCAGEQGLPDTVHRRRHGQALRFGLTGGVKQAQLHCLRMG